MTTARVVIVAFLTGAAVMVVELMGVRLLAPWFGQSQLVWTNVIGVVLAALALGQWLGGRAAGGRGGIGPAGLLAFGGAAACVLPECVRLLSPLILPDDLPLLQAHPFVVLGSLLVAFVGLGVPMVALGAVAPLLVHLSREAQQSPGRVAGRVLGAGTAGSLVGTFGATHLLLGWVGSDGAVRLAGAALLLSALLLVRGPKVPAVLGALCAATLTFLGRGLHSSPSDGVVLASVETPYQWARIEESADGLRLLRINEGLDSFHSAWRPGDVLTGLYFDAFLMPALAAPRGEDGRRAVLVLGLAGGTMARQLLELDPSARVRGVEIDADIVDLGRRWLGLPDAVEVDAGVDARVAVHRIPMRWGAVLVDVYASQIYVPPHLASVEFFETLRARLLPGGLAALNVGGLSIEDPVVAGLVHSVAAAFGEAFFTRIPGTRNMLVLGCNGPLPAGDAWRAAARAAGLPESLADGPFTRVASEAPGGRILRDGHAPVEALAHASWAGRWVPFAPEARAPASDVPWLAAGRALLQATRWTEAWDVLDHPPLDASPVERARAQLLLGNIAYERGDLDEAARRYDGAAALVPEELPAAQQAEARSVRLAAASNAAELLAPATALRRRLADAERRLVVVLLVMATFAAAGAWALARRVHVQRAAG